MGSIGHPVVKEFYDMFSRVDTIQECHGQTGRIAVSISHELMDGCAVNFTVNS